MLAARLSEDPRERVTLLEAGPDFPEASALPTRLRDSLGPAPEGFEWNRSARSAEPAGRILPYPLGRVMGGSSTINGSNAMRGLPRDYDEWASLGNAGWSWPEVLPYFVRLETDHDFAGGFHGAGGPIPIRRLDPQGGPAAVRAFLAAARERGLAYCADQNAPDAAGVGPLPRNMEDGRRAGTLLTYLPAARRRENVELRGGTAVRRVLLDGGRAVGVEAEHEGVRREVLADRVVLAAGAIHSPVLLLGSGIGSRTQLERCGEERLVDLPGVGRHLADHPVLHLLVPLRTPVDDGARAFRLVVRSTSSIGPPDDLMLVAGLAPAPPGDPEGASVFKIAALVAKPSSRGWVGRRSGGGGEPEPDIHLRLLAGEDDRLRMRAAFRLACDVLAAPALAAELAAGEVSWPGPEDVDARLDDWLVEHVRTSYHPVGTCRMGPPDDALAVVGPRLAVHRASQLFVVDASVMPTIPTGMVHLSCLMIAERAADWLRET